LKKRTKKLLLFRIVPRFSLERSLGRQFQKFFASFFQKRRLSSFACLNAHLARLVCAWHAPYLCAMRALLPALLAIALSLPASAQPAKAPPRHDGAPRFIGRFGQWIVATRSEDDAKTCFVFTRAEASPQKIPGRGDVVLSVTRRPRRHDVVALSAGFLLAGHEDAPLQAGATKMLFYIAGRSAFAHDNAAAIAAFGQESSVTAKLNFSRGITATDRFSLQGFTSAYAALGKACPAQ
jgi:hypothetical protein